MHGRLRPLIPLLLSALAGAAHAMDALSVAEAAVMYDAPSQKARPLFVIARDTPVEPVVTLDAWIKVRDSKGDLAWIEKRHLSEKRTVLVKAARAKIRSEADEKASMVFEAEKDVILELVEPGPSGWARVKHRGGQAGFVRTVEVWGL